MLEELIIEKGLSYLNSSRKLRETDSLNSLRQLYLANDYFVKAMLENNINVRHRGYVFYKETQQEAWEIVSNLSRDVGQHVAGESDDWTDKTVVKSGYTFDDIIGYDYVKEKFRVHIIYPRTKKMPFKIKANNTVLMYGPPGCGKSFFASALSNEIGEGTMYSIDASNILSKYYGESSRNISMIFDMLKGNENNVLFIDEIDALSMKRDFSDPAANRTISTLLLQIDGIDKTDINLIAATNKPDLIDEAIMNRFNSSLYIPPPDKSSKEFIFDLEVKRQLEGHTPDLDIGKIASHMEDKELEGSRFSGRDIRKIVTNTLEIASIDYVVNGSFSIDNKLFYQMIDEVVPSLSKKMLKKYEEFDL